jgi:Tfp pilus assembly protein FimT
MVRLMAKDLALEDVRERIARQEQVIAHLAANGRSTILAEKRLASLRHALDAMLQRRRARAERQTNILCIPVSGQFGQAERDGQPGSEAP